MRQGIAGGILVGLALGVVPSATDRPSETLPDRDAFVAEVRARLRTDEELQNQYTYVEKRQRIRISKLGQVELGDTRLSEVYPGSQPGQRYRRLIAVNDVPLDATVLEQRDAARQKFLADRAEILTNETPAERASRERRQAEIRRRQQDIVDDVFGVFEMRVVGEDVLDGQRVIAVSLTPRAGVAPRSRTGRYFPKFHGTAWVTAGEYQVVKADLEASSDVLVGLGLVGRVHKGSRFTFERKRINEVWLPARVVIELVGRTLLVRKFSVRAVTEFSDYRKFAVTTAETFDTEGLTQSSR
jgi:hypothetical protein